MAVLEVGKLVAPVSADAPSGPNLEYDPAFLELEKAAQGKAEQVIGGVASAAEPPDWNVVFSQAGALLERSKDLRVLSHLALALLNRNGVAGFSEGLAAIRGLLEAQWASLHPQLDPEDNNDPTMRVTALAALATSPNLLALRNAPILISRAIGPLTHSDIAPTSGSPDAAKVQAVLIDSTLPDLEACSLALKVGFEALQGIEQVFQAQTGDRGPDLTQVLRCFQQMRQAVDPKLEERRAAEQGAAAAAGGDAAAAAPPARGLSGDILSREDVVRAFDKISSYFEKNEPSSPIPLLVERCKRLVTMNFMEILGDLAPDSVKQAQVVVGKRDGK
jgi:type VI secretion system protein ImpA